MTREGPCFECNQTKPLCPDYLCPECCYQDLGGLSHTEFNKLYGGKT